MGRTVAVIGGGRGGAAIAARLRGRIGRTTCAFPTIGRLVEAG